MTDLHTCETCGGIGYWVHRWGPDDNVEQEMCEVCRGTGDIPNCGFRVCDNPVWERSLDFGYCEHHDRLIIKAFTVMAIDR